MENFLLALVLFLKQPIFSRILFAYTICLIIGYFTIKNIKKNYIGREDEINTQSLINSFLFPFVYCLLGFTNILLAIAVCFIPLLICLLAGYSTRFIWKICVPIVALILIFGTKYIDKKFDEQLKTAYNAENKVIALFPGAILEKIEKSISK